MHMNIQITHYQYPCIEYIQHNKPHVAVVFDYKSKHQSITRKWQWSIDHLIVMFDWRIYSTRCALRSMTNCTGSDQWVCVCICMCVREATYRLYAGHTLNSSCKSYFLMRAWFLKKTGNAGHCVYHAGSECWYTVYQYNRTLHASCSLLYCKLCKLIPPSPHIPIATILPVRLAWVWVGLAQTRMISSSCIRTLMHIHYTHLKATANMHTYIHTHTITHTTHTHTHTHKEQW